MSFDCGSYQEVLTFYYLSLDLFMHTDFSFSLSFYIQVNKYESLCFQAYVKVPLERECFINDNTRVCLIMPTCLPWRLESKP